MQGLTFYVDGVEDPPASPSPPSEHAQHAAPPTPTPTPAGAQYLRSRATKEQQQQKQAAGGGGGGRAKAASFPAPPPSAALLQPLSFALRLAVHKGAEPYPGGAPGGGGSGGGAGAAAGGASTSSSVHHGPSAGGGAGAAGAPGKASGHAKRCGRRCLRKSCTRLVRSALAPILRFALLLTLCALRALASAPRGGDDTQHRRTPCPVRPACLGEAPMRLEALVCARIPLTHSRGVRSFALPESRRGVHAAGSAGGRRATAASAEPRQAVGAAAAQRPSGGVGQAAAVRAVPPPRLGQQRCVRGRCCAIMVLCAVLGFVDVWVWAKRYGRSHPLGRDSSGTLAAPLVPFPAPFSNVWGSQDVGRSRAPGEKAATCGSDAVLLWMSRAAWCPQVRGAALTARRALTAAAAPRPPRMGACGGTAAGRSRLRPVRDLPATTQRPSPPPATAGRWWVRRSSRTRRAPPRRLRNRSTRAPRRRRWLPPGSAPGALQLALHPSLPFDCSCCFLE